MTSDPKARKATPICSGVLDYFPDALAAVARLSFKANEKHNPGMPMHWSRGKSADHADCLGRHLIERGETDPETGESFTVHVAWRALALLQEEIEASVSQNVTQSAATGLDVARCAVECPGSTLPAGKITY